MFQPLKSTAGFNSRNELARSITMPAPIGGLNTRDSLAEMNAIYALDMRNFWPQDSKVTIRRGCQNHCAGLPQEAKTLAGWSGLAGSKLFACTDAGIFDATAAGPAPQAAVTTLTEGYVSYVNYSTAGGSFLALVNGKDSYKYYNGAAWTELATLAVPAAPAETIQTKDLFYIQVHQRALYFLKKASLDFYFLPVGQITGDLKKFPLTSLFSAGGHLVAIGSWTVDGGEGKDDYAAFLTSEGQLAIYAGTDPASADNWALKGVFNVGRPIGLVPLVKSGGDLLILTVNGIMSLMQMLSKGTASTERALTAIINSRFVELRQNQEDKPDWQMLVDPSRNLLLVNIPSGARARASQLAMNMSTGAWTEFYGWDSRRWELYKGELYSSIGKDVVRMWTLTDDRGIPITAIVKCAWTYLGPRSRTKQVNLGRFVFKSQGGINVQIGLDTDYRQDDNYFTIKQSEADLPVWDISKWDEVRWSNSADINLDWVSLNGQQGYCFSPRMRIYASSSIFEWTSTNLTYTTGGLL